MGIVILTLWLSFAFADGPKCYTTQDVKNEGCRVLCVRDGYKSGSYSKGSCKCIDEKKYNQMVSPIVELKYFKPSGNYQEPESQEPY